MVFKVKECSWAAQTGVAAAGAAEAGTVSRRLLARNAGRVGVQLGGWRVGGARGAADGAGGECEARGWRVSPCAPLSLPPNASAPLHVAFAPDYSLARVTATLHLHTDLGTGRAWPPDTTDHVSTYLYRNANKKDISA